MSNQVDPVAIAVVVVAGGDRPDPRTVALLPAGARVVAADSGADHAIALGLHVDDLVGDLDSVTPEGLALVERQGGVVERHPAAKDHTDLELALRAAVGRGATRIVVLGGHGGRADHQLAGVLLLAAPWLAAATVTAWHGDALLSVVRAGAPLALHGAVGSTVTLVPVDDVAGITTTGLAYPLAGETLPAGTTRGVSNELTGTEATVTTAAGALLAVQPEALDHHLATRTDQEDHR